MSHLTQSQLDLLERQRYLRPLIVSISLSMTAESIIFLVFGIFYFQAAPD